MSPCSRHSDTAAAEGQELVVALADGVEDHSPIIARLITEGHQVLTVRLQEVNLETAFLELTRGRIAPS